MRRTVVLAGLVVAAAAALVWRDLADQRVQRELWTEVTDPLP